MKTISALMAMTLLTGAFAWAETIEFPQEELATETVLPVFDNPEAVKSRTIEVTRRFELGAQASYNLTEAFFNNYSLSGSIGYNFTEEHGMSLFGAFFLPGVTNYTNQLNPPPGSSQNMNLQFAPHPKYLILGNYQYTGFYGKMSVARDFIMNLSLFGLAGIGGIYVGDKMFPVLSFGLGQKFYFNSQLALRFDLRALIYQGPNILSTNLVNATSDQSTSKFSNRLLIGSLLSVGMIWLVPGS